MTILMTPPVQSTTHEGTYSGDARSAVQARHDAKDVITSWGMGDIVYESMQIIAEMMANAVGHSAQEPVRMVLTRLDNGVRIAVHDSCTRPVIPRDAAPSDENGRGMALIEEFASGWGWEWMSTCTLADGRNVTGKRVWATVVL